MFFHIKIGRIRLKIEGGIKMNNENNTLYYLEKAPVSKAIVHMAVPMILSMVINIVYNITDAFFIGMLNNTSMLAAITLALPFTTILMALGEIFGTGGSTYISRLLGENNLERVKKASSVNFYLSLFTGVIFILISVPFMPQILQVLGVGVETAGPTRDYVLAYTFGAPFVIANFNLGQTVRGEGASKESLIGMIISVAVNMILDPVFIFSFHMGITGAAIATVIGNVCAVIYYIWYLAKKSSVQSVSFRYFKPDMKILGNIFKVGISAFLLSCFLIVSGLMFNNYAMIYGEHVVAAFGIANRVCQISDFIGMGLYMGVVPLIAYSYAAGDTERLNRILKTVFIYLGAIVFGIAVVLFFFREQVIRMFSSDIEVIRVGVTILAALLASTLFAGLSGMFTSMFQAFGKGVQSNIMSVTRGIALIPVIVIGNFMFGLTGVIWAMTISEFCACLMGVGLWILARKGIMGVPVKERAEFDIDMG